MPTPAIDAVIASLAAEQEPTSADTAAAIIEVVRIFVGIAADITRIADAMEAPEITYQEPQ